MRTSAGVASFLAIRWAAVATIAAAVPACGGGREGPTAPSAPAAGTDVGSSDTATGASTIRRFEAGEALLAARGLEGTFVFRRTGEPDLWAAFPERADVPDIPASTFKIANTLIGLETGVIPDESFSLPWDGVTRDLEAWNRDHDLASAMAESVVWFYQEIARRIGHARMAEWVARLGYGNAETGGEELIDLFWLMGPLAITARQQVEFLERLTSGELPVSSRNVDILRRLMPSRALGAGTMLAKTGTYVSETSGHAWLVGWVEQGGAVLAHFALLLAASPESVPERELRWEAAGEQLEAAGVVEAAPSSSSTFDHDPKGVPAFRSREVVSLQPS